MTTVDVTGAMERMQMQATSSNLLNSLSNPTDRYTSTTTEHRSSQSARSRKQNSSTPSSLLSNGILSWKEKHVSHFCVVTIALPWLAGSTAPHRGLKSEHPTRSAPHQHVALSNEINKNIKDPSLIIQNTDLEHLT